MTKDKLKPLIPYAGLPLILVVLLIMQIGRIETFLVLKNTLLVIFGYIASVLDIKTKKIPNTLVLAMLAAWVVLIVPQLFFSIETAIAYLLDSLLGFAICGGLLLFIYFISRKGLGGGDVKFMAAAGLYLGMSGSLPALLYGSVLAGLTGLILIVLKKIRRKDSIPLAPFLFVGILLTVFFM
jgi:Flp pilus assembly protein protease CpaA